MKSPLSHAAAAVASGRATNPRLTFTPTLLTNRGIWLALEVFAASRNLILLPPSRPKPPQNVLSLLQGTLSCKPFYGLPVELAFCSRGAAVLAKL